MHTNDRPHTFSATRCAAWFAVAALTLGMVTAVAGTPVSASPAQEAPAKGIGLRLIDAPISAKDDPRARIYIVDHLSPGTVIERRVEVVNTTDSAQPVTLYSAAASIDDGTFVGAPGTKLNDLASWTAVTPGTAAIPAGGKKIALVTISVPADAAPGEQYGVVWAETRSAPSDDGGVAQVSRVGIRLYVSIGPGGAPAADFEISALTAERTPDGAPAVSATVRNTGGRALDMKGDLELTNGPGSLTAGPFPAEVGSTLAIGDTQEVRITLDERLPDGPWTATVTLESGLTERSAEATITFPDEGAAAPVATSGLGTERPWMMFLAAGALLTLLVVAGWSIRRRWRTGERRRYSGAHLSAADL